MNNLDKKYTDLLQDILDNGVEKKDRTGTGTISVFGRQIRHKMSEGFPLLTTKKMYMKGVITELLWFLRGDTNIQSLVQNNCHIWDGDAYKNYLKNRDSFSNRDNVKEDVVINGMNGSSNRVYTMEEFINTIRTNNVFAERWGELGPVYGKQWRSWGGKLVTKRIKEESKIPYDQNILEGQIDQISNLISELKTNPDSRRLMVNAWNVGEIDEMVLPPCHYGFQVYTRELSWEDRFELFKKQNNGSHPYDNEMLDDYNIPTRAISLMWNQRSVDTFLGLPFNIASYGLLLEILAKEVNMIPDELIGNLGDVHLYSNHIEQAREQIGRERTHEEMVEMYYAIENKKDREEYWTWETRFDDNNISKHTRNPYPLPRLKIKQSINTEPGILLKPEFWHSDDFIIENYQSHTTIKAPLSN